MEMAGFGVIESMIRAATQNSPRTTEATVHSLSRLMAGVRHTGWPEVAWSFSHLTGTGVPIEFSWSPAERAVRYTCEIAGPESDPEDRLEQALGLLRELGASPLPGDLLGRLRELQFSGPLHYGAWVGGRHTEQGDDYKLYAEAPEKDSAASFLERYFGGRAFLPTRPVRFRLAAYAMGARRLEFYFRIGELEVWELGLLLDRCGLYHRLPDLLSLVEAAYGFPIGERLPGSNFGFSIAPATERKPAVLSLFAYADCVFGNDRVAREAILRLASARGWRSDDYAAMSCPRDGGGEPVVNHGMIAFVVSKTGPPFLQVGFAPSLG
jgi:hypothetical protein